MNSLELKGLRIARGKTQSYMGERIEKSLDSYAKKERGEVLFTPEEIAIVASELEMTFEQFNAIFLQIDYRLVMVEATSHRLVIV